jgi:predicted PhzF superfamily epimerase YddE/YHI9
MKLPAHQIDAFASRVFAGNPAVVVCLDDWLDDAVLQSIAADGWHDDSSTPLIMSFDKPDEDR